MSSRWVIHLEKGDDDKMIFRFGGQFYLPVRAMGWLVSIGLIILTGSYIF